MADALPIHWTFRRCPYAIRARLAVDVAQIPVEYREIVLRDKPARMLEHSPKGTVPILVLSDGAVIDESINIMHWALAKNDPEHWLGQDVKESGAIESWVQANDDFKPHLDRYKYPDRYEEVDHAHEVECCRAHLERLNTQLEQTGRLVGTRDTLADMALMPFVRQFHHVDKSKLPEWRFDALQAWLDRLMQSPRFNRVMVKRSLWVGRGRAGGVRDAHDTASGTK